MSGIYDEEILGAKQQQETARKLREGIKSPEGQMVSGWYVQPSITQYMAEALKGYYAGKEGREAKTKYDTLSKQKSDETARLLKRMEPKADVTVSPELMRGDVSGMMNSPNPATQTTYTQPDEQTRMSALSQGLAVNPGAFAGPAQMEMYGMSRQDKKEAAAQAQQDRIELERQRALDRQMMRGQSDAQRGQIIYDNQGNVFNVNPYTNEVRPVATGGKQIQGAQWSPDLQKNIAGAKAVGTAQGAAQGTAQTGLDNTLFQGETTLKQLDDLLAHPGFSTAVGIGNEITRFAPSGSEPRNFLTRLDQLKGGQFLQAYQTLKGGGQITEVEGKKATEAIARMNATSSEAEFKQAVKDFADVIRAGMSRAQNQAQGNFAPVNSTPTVSGGSSGIDALLQKYGN